MATLPEATSPRSTNNAGGSTKKPAAPHEPDPGNLTDEMLARFDSRAATYDRENRFFDQDFEELRVAKYLLMPVPKQFGGPGLNLTEVCRAQRRLAYHAPATALAVNMHLYWVGVAADLWNRGDTSLEWMLRDAAAGEIFAAGHAESGNDIPVLLSSAKAEPVEGGYCFTGRKQFGSLTPVWTRFGVHGMDTSDPSHPKVVHAFMPRDNSDYIIKENWDVLGMRATRSDDTVIENAFIPNRYVVRVVLAGGAGIDAFLLSVFAWALLGFANVYYGLAKRALDKSIVSAKSKRSIALSRSMAYHPEVNTPSRKWSSSWNRSVHTWIVSRRTGRTESITEPHGPRRFLQPNTGPSKPAGGWWIWASTLPAGRESSVLQATKGCCAMHVLAAFIPPILS